MTETLNTIQVGKYRISRSDERNLQVEEFKIVKAKKGRYVKEARETEKWTFRGYFPNVKSAVQGIIGFQTMDGVEQATDLRELITFITKSEKEIVSAVQEARLTLDSMTRHLDGRGKSAE